MLPNLLIIGAQKSGTSSLHHYLSLHPEVAMSQPKELDFFVEGADHYDHWRPGNWHRGVDWYSARFTTPAPVRGEASPEYTSYPRLKGVPERAASVVGGAKLIYLVRDPIERMVSQYLHRRAAGQETRSLDDALEDTEHGYGVDYLPRSLYFMQVSQWLEHFPRDQLLVISLEDMVADLDGSMRGVFRFLGIDESFTSEGFREVQQRTADKRHLTGGARRLAPLLRRSVASLPAEPRRRFRRAYRAAFGRSVERPAPSAERRARLEDALAEDVARLRGLTGRPFSAWSL